MAPVVKNPTAELIDSINGLIESNKAIVNANKEQLDTLWRVVVTGDLEKGIPSLIETTRNHEKVINDFQRAKWIVIGAILTALLGGGWYVALHVFGGVK